MNILVGSKAFFAEMPDFRTKGTDFVRIVDNPINFNFVRHINGNTGNTFEWNRLSPQEHIAYALQKGTAEQLGKFLVPQFATAIDFTISHLQQLAPLTEQLEPKHAWLKIIFDAYLANNDFSLTAEQRQNAYAAYKNARKKAETNP